MATSNRFIGKSISFLLEESKAKQNWCRVFLILFPNIFFLKIKAMSEVLFLAYKVVNP